MARERADILLLKQGLFESRSQAQKAIMSGFVRIGLDHVVRNASEKCDEDTVFSLTEPMPYVSRGAYKLLHALDQYAPDLTGKRALDIGASTGGFTDLMLQRGAEYVYAVDVGHGQLHYKLREHPAVRCLEHTNARYLTVDIIPEPVDVVTMDVSFISVKLILPALPALLSPGAHAFVLVKPQFEAERHESPKGVVKSADVRNRVVAEVVSFACSELTWKHLGTLPSPIQGPKGNQEYISAFITS
jgi:23S rRNA (cytidine1920-2'-O)/16S rRNA (cytidine1409-2'-O)-methyltransferase